MADNNKFIDAAVGYRPQTAFPLNAGEYFESMAEAEAAAAGAAEVGTPAANTASHYIGQTLTVYERSNSPHVSEPVMLLDVFREAAQRAVDKHIPVVLITVGNPDASSDPESQKLAQILNSETWRNYVRLNSDRCYFAYGQYTVDENLWRAISQPVDGVDPLTAVYSATSWINEDPEALAKAGAVLYAGEDSSFVNFDINLQDDDFDEYSLVSSVDEIINRAERANVSMYQIQPDRTLKPVGQGIQDIPVDGVSIGKDAGGTLYLKAVLDGMLDQSTIYKEDGKIALKAVPEDMLAGYSYVKLSSLTGYLEPSGEKKYRIQTASDGAAFVHVPWSGGGEIPQEYKTYAETSAALTSQSGFKTYAQTSAQLSNDGYATRAWVQEQGFAGGGISLSDVQATIFDFGSGDLSSFGWTGELSRQDLIDAGIKDSSGTVVKNPVAVRIGNGVTSIGTYAFHNCRRLTGVTIPDSVTSIGETAFYYCTDLIGVTIPDSVTSVGTAAFSDCRGLTSVMIGNGVTSIGNSVFYGCTGLSSVTIPDSVTSVGSSAFSGCSRLFEIKVEGKTQSEAEALLAGALVPAGCRIKTWSFVPPIYNFTTQTLVAYQPKCTSNEYTTCQYTTQVDGWYTFHTDINPDADSVTNVMMISYVAVNDKVLYRNLAGSIWTATCYIKAGCVLRLHAFTSYTTSNNASGARYIYLLT